MTKRIIKFPSRARPRLQASIETAAAAFAQSSNADKVQHYALQKISLLFSSMAQESRSTLKRQMITMLERPVDAPWHDVMLTLAVLDEQNKAGLLIRLKRERDQGYLDPPKS